MGVEALAGTIMGVEAFGRTIPAKASTPGSMSFRRVFEEKSQRPMPINAVGIPQRTSE